jgi:hypothetical protein
LQYAILMVNLTQSLLKYILSVTEIRRAHRVGGAIAPPWEDKPIYGFYIELSTGTPSLPPWLYFLTQRNSLCGAYHLFNLFCDYVHIPLNPDIRHQRRLCGRQSLHHKISCLRSV